MPLNAPPPSWSKITGKPTTVAGYGITDVAAQVPNTLAGLGITDTDFNNKLNNLPLFNSSVGGTSGYQKFPSGMVLQWGSRTTSTTGTQTFPIAFTSCTSVQFTGAVTGSEFVSAITATNFTYTCPSGPSYWIAIGYI